MTDGCSEAARMRRGSPSPERERTEKRRRVDEPKPKEGRRPISKQNEAHWVYYVSNALEEGGLYTTGYVGEDKDWAQNAIATVTTNGPMTEEQLHRTRTFLSQTFGIVADS